MAHNDISAPETQISGFADYVREAEQTRAFLQEEREYALSAGGDLVTQIELILFYSRAFAQVIQRLPDAMHSEGWQAQIVQEAIVGRTAYWEWRRHTTSTIAPLELYQMQQRWENIVEFLAYTEMKLRTV